VAAGMAAAAAVGAVAAHAAADAACWTLLLLSCHIECRQAVKCLPLLVVGRCCAGRMLQHADDAVLTQGRLLVVAVVVALRLTEILDLVRPRKKVIAGGVVDRPAAGQNSSTGQCSSRRSMKLPQRQQQQVRQTSGEKNAKCRGYQSCLVSSTADSVLSCRNCCCCC
jgi:hypothetical protein